ncbi:pilin [Patescibacteria group bacterium]|nr:pilin [Patescibacteria group bacterium]
MKKIKIIILILLMFAGSSFVSGFILVDQARAVEDTMDPRELQLKIPFGQFSDLGKIQEVTAKKKNPLTGEDETYKFIEIPWLAKYIGNVYRYGVGLGSIIAVLALMLGGLMYMSAGLSPAMVGRSKQIMLGAVTGLVLLLGSYIMLYVINPNLIQLKPIQVEIVKTAVMVGETSCSVLGNADQPVYKSVEVDPTKSGSKGTSGATWNTSKETCGETFPVRLKAGVEKKGELTVGGQTCMSDYCENENLSCINDIATGKRSCKSVFINGSITIPTAVDSLLCGNALGAAALGLKLSEGFYLDSLKLVYRSPGTTDWKPLSEPIALAEGGKMQTSYGIERKDLIGAVRLKDMPANTQLALEIEVNNASLVLLPTIDKTFVVSADSGDPKLATSVAPIIACRSGSPAVSIYQRKQHLASKEISIGDAAKIWKIVPPEKTLTVGALRASTSGVKWDINITANFFNCKKDLGTVEFKEPGCSALSVIGNCEGAGVGNTCVREESSTVFSQGQSITRKVKVPIPNACPAPLICNVEAEVCSCGSANTSCVSDASCSAENYCNFNICSPRDGNKGDSCQPGKVFKEADGSLSAIQVCKYNSAGGSAGLICDANLPNTTNVCVDGPKQCSSEDDCKALPYKDADCTAGYCDCDDDDDACAGLQRDGSFYRCAENKSDELYGGADSCVLKPVVGSGENCDPEDKWACVAGYFCGDEINKCVKAPVACIDDTGEEADYICVDYAGDVEVYAGWGRPADNQSWTGDCQNGYCNCDDDDECADGYTCINNITDLYNSNGTCAVVEN